MRNMTRAQITEKGKEYDNINNEGGDGYNPYWQELDRRGMEAAKIEAAKPKSKKEQISILHDKIRIECGSVAREWGSDEIDKKQAAYYAEVKALENEIKAEFANEWTIETTKERRISWNDFVRSLMDSQGHILGKDQLKMYQRAKDQGWGPDDLKKAVELHSL